MEEAIFVPIWKYTLENCQHLSNSWTGYFPNFLPISMYGGVTALLIFYLLLFCKAICRKDKKFENNTFKGKDHKCGLTQDKNSSKKW